MRQEALLRQRLEKGQVRKSRRICGQYGQRFSTDALWICPENVNKTLTKMGHSQRERIHSVLFFMLTAWLNVSSGFADEHRIRLVRTCP